MAYETFTEFNSTGLAGLFLYPANVWGGFIPLILFALFAITFMSTFFSQKRLIGKGDFIASFAVASYFVAIVAFVMSLTDGLINITTVVVCVVLTIIGTILLFTGKDRY